MTTRAASVLGGLIVVMLALASFALISGQGGVPGPNVTPTSSDLTPTPDDTFVAIGSPTPSPSFGASPTSIVTTSPTSNQTVGSSPSPTPAATGTNSTPPGTEVEGTAETGPPVAAGLMGLIPFGLGAVGFIVRRRL